MSDEKPKAEGQCLDLEFYVDSLWRFHVTDLGRNFKSYDEMREAIERSHKTVVAAKRRKLQIPVRDRKGNSLILTGVHAGHGHPITSPPSDDALYFDTPLVAQALAEHRRLAYDAVRVDALLEKHQVHERRGYRSFEPSMHEGEIKRIEKAHAAAQKIADKPLMEVLAEIKAEPIEFD